MGRRSGQWTRVPRDNLSHKTQLSREPKIRLKNSVKLAQNRGICGTIKGVKMHFYNLLVDSIL